MNPSALNLASIQASQGPSRGAFETEGHSFSQISGSSSPSWSEQLWLQVDFAQLRQSARQLKQTSTSFENPHVTEANLANEFQPRVLRKSLDTLVSIEGVVFHVLSRRASKLTGIVLVTRNIAILVSISFTPGPVFTYY
jgi:hypothetical protein